MTVKELMAYTPEHKIEVASTVLELCLEVLNMEFIGVVRFFNDRIGETFNGAVPTDSDELILSLEKMTGEGYPDVLPGEAVFLQICHVVAHEVRHVFQKRLAYERWRIFEGNPELDDEARINGFIEGLNAYWNLNGEAYELQTLEIDANCFAVLVSCTLSGCVMQPSGSAKEKYTEGISKLIELYGETLKETLTLEHFEEVLKENEEFYRES